VQQPQQPLLGLLHLSQDQAAARTSAEAAGQQAQGVEATVREQVATGFLRYFEARALIETARSSEGQLAEQGHLADARLRAGVITQADALRIATALANARLQEAYAQAQADSARAALLVGLGYSPDAQTVEFVEPKELVEQAPKILEEPAVQRDAMERRPEVKAAALLNEAAQKQQQGRFFALLPEVNLEAAYVKIDGQKFASPEDKYVGIKATWPIFTWGADYYAYQASSAQARAQAQQAEDQVRNVRIDASGKLALLRATSAAVELSQTAIQSAEEAYRVTNAQVKAGVATSTSDLLDAESALTSARLSLVRAKYERAIAVVALRRATGG
jgi:outer membrane protein TolC